MAKSCERCGKKLSIFSRQNVCDDCRRAESEILNRLAKEIAVTRAVTDDQLALLARQSKESGQQLFAWIYDRLQADKEIDQMDMAALETVQRGLGLSNEDVDYDGRVRPYVYVNAIRNDGRLPVIALQIEGGSPILLKKGEQIHFADKAVLKELRSVSLGYSGGSHGVSLRIAKGVSYRIGAHRGHAVREDKLVETSRGVLTVTSQRIFLHPSAGHKPLSIPLAKVLSYQCFENGVEVYKEGREKGYLLAMKSSSVEVCGLCLGHLLAQ